MRVPIILFLHPNESFYLPQDTWLYYRDHSFRPYSQPLLSVSFLHCISTFWNSRMPDVSQLKWQYSWQNSFIQHLKNHVLCLPEFYLLAESQIFLMQICVHYWYVMLVYNTGSIVCNKFLLLMFDNIYLIIITTTKITTTNNYYFFTGINNFGIYWYK